MVYLCRSAVATGANLARLQYLIPIISQAPSGTVTCNVVCMQVIGDRSMIDLANIKMLATYCCSNTCAIGMKRQLVVETKAALAATLLSFFPLY